LLKLLWPRATAISKPALGLMAGSGTGQVWGSSCIGDGGMRLTLKGTFITAAPREGSLSPRACSDPGGNAPSYMDLFFGEENSYVETLDVSHCKGTFGSNDFKPILMGSSCVSSNVATAVADISNESAMTVPSELVVDEVVAKMHKIPWPKTGSLSWHSTSTEHDVQAVFDPHLSLEEFEFHQCMDETNDIA